jgi:hypothetical protein
MLAKPIIEISETDLVELVDDRYREGKILEFKTDLWRLVKADNPDQVDRDSQTIEFLKDVSSFANADGGHLIVGIKDKDGAASELRGIKVKSQDLWKNKLDALMQSWIDPRIHAETRFVDLQSGKQALIISVAASTIGPHRVTFQEHGHFYSRNSHGAFRMDTEELRTGFTRSYSLAESIRRFRMQRIELIEGRDIPISLTYDPHLILHLIPQAFFSTRADFSIEELKQHERLLGPPGERHWAIRPNLDGVLTVSGRMEEKDARARGFVQLFRSGAIESAYSGISFRHRNGTRYWSPHAESSLISAVPEYLKCMSQLGVASPVWMFVTLCRMNDVQYIADMDLGRPFDRAQIFIPEFRIDDFQSPAHQILRPVLDQIWNAMGHDRCLRISETGERQDLGLDRAFDFL